MFPRNISFLVKPVKDKPNAVVDPTDPAPLIDAISKGAATVVAVYMGCDTLRKIIVHTVATRIT
jgi:hydroxylamine reductase (hybrid-cluster protein)